MLDVGRLNSNSKMANKIILMTKLRQILRLFAQGESKRKISERTGISRNTLKKYILEYLEKRLTIEVINEMSDHALEAVFGTMVEPVKDSRYEELQLLLPNTHPTDHDIRDANDGVVGNLV